jgi:hypothetical protein
MTWLPVVEGTSLGQDAAVRGLDGQLSLLQAWSDTDGVQVIVTGDATLDADQADKLCEEIRRLVHGDAPQDIEGGD